jgi:Na+/proline symporter
MTLADGAAIILVLLTLLGVSLGYSRRARSHTEEFLLGGRRLPWWLAGISTVATGINVNTPLVDGRKIRSDGVGGLWFQWQGAIGNLISIPWLNLLWKRSGVATPLQIFELRYSSREARVARGMDATLICVVNAVLWSCGGLVAFKKISVVLFGLPDSFQILGVSLPSDATVLVSGVLMAWVFSSLSGVYSIVWTDLAEAVLVVGCAYFMFLRAYAELGWAPGLRSAVEGLGDQGERILRMLPEVGPALVVLLLIQPIVTQGQWSPATQRILCVSSERDVLKTGYFSQFVNWVVRPWPFLILGLCGIFLVSDAELLARFPALTTPNGMRIPDYEMAFPALAFRLLPPGMVGLLMAGFLISFMSSLASNIHSNAAAFLNDLYCPFLNPKAGEPLRLTVIRTYMGAQMAVALVLAIFVDNVLAIAMLAFTINCSSGIIKGLRFFWWRVNGKAELVSILVGFVSLSIWFSPWGESVVASLGRSFGQESNDAYYAIRFLLIVGASSSVGIATTLISKPEDDAVLDTFYRRVRPHGAWGPVAGRNQDRPPPVPATLLFETMFLGIGLVFGGIFAAIGLLLAFPLLAVFAATVSGGCAWLLKRAVNRIAPLEESQLVGSGRRAVRPTAPPRGDLRRRRQ